MDGQARVREFPSVRLGEYTLGRRTSRRTARRFVLINRWIWDTTPPRLMAAVSTLCEPEVKTGSFVRSVWTTVMFDVAPFRQWYENYYLTSLGKKRDLKTSEVNVLAKKRSKICSRSTPRCIPPWRSSSTRVVFVSRPGQSGPVNGYLLEGKERRSNDRFKSQNCIWSKFPALLALPNSALADASGWDALVVVVDLALAGPGWRRFFGDSIAPIRCSDTLDGPHRPRNPPCLRRCGHLFRRSEVCGTDGRGNTCIFSG
ncbi:hypothetical protein pipiens_001067 [Culex pipiens pipiens]|uniref:Uncharacterized protein n=1 Tax=Culex pipiens pipiens TaxID=38569 RepID=A0ABD1CWN2_CULPP